MNIPRQVCICVSPDAARSSHQSRGQFSLLQKKGSSVCYKQKAVQSVTNKRQFSLLQTKGSSVCYKQKAVQSVTNERQFSLLQTKGSSVCYKRKAVQSVTKKGSSVCYKLKGSSVCYDSLLFYKRLLLYAILSSLDRCCTSNFTLIESCLTVHHHNCHGLWPFSINLSLSLIP